MCGRQHDRNHWIAPSHDPVVMGGLSRRGDAPDKPSSSHEGNVDAGYPPGGRRMNDFFFLPSTTHLVHTDNKASELKQLLNCFLFNVKGIAHFESCCRASALLATLSYVTKILERCQKWNGVPILSCKIWHGEENNGMASRLQALGQDDERLWHCHTCDKRTVIEAVHA